ncbi:MAG: LrgB family protein [Clostridia bacterium]
MEAIFSSPFFGITLSILAYQVGLLCKKKWQLDIVNPLVIAVTIIIMVLKIFDISFEQYNAGGAYISLMLAPVTAALGVAIYQQWQTLKDNWLPIVVGVVVGSLSSVWSIRILSQMFGLQPQLAVSLLAKSVTTPIAVELSQQLGGIEAVTVAGVIFTGIFGAVFSPLLIKLLKIKNPIARGVAIGTSSHGLGTSKALEIGKVEGAMSGIAMGLAGVVTVIIILLL